MPHRVRPLLFRIFYSTSFTIVFLLIVAHVLLTPADAVYQSYKEGRIFDIFIITGVYVLTALIAALLYASRLYTNRSILQGIPKPYIPVEKDDLPGKWVRKMIADGLARSAVVAYEARPKVKKAEHLSQNAHLHASTHSEQDGLAGELKLAWTRIAHPGWSSPCSPDIPEMYFNTVVAELPDLIEAKAVSLIPADPLTTPNGDGIAMPDERLVEIVQRPAEMGLREYIGQLLGLGVIRDQVLSKDFLALYERARFAADPLQETEFRSVMSIFAQILRGLNRLDPGLIAQIQENSSPSPDADINISADAGNNEDGQDSGSIVSSAAGSSRRQSDLNGKSRRRVPRDLVPSMGTSDEEYVLAQQSQGARPSLWSASHGKSNSRLTSSTRGLHKTRSNVSRSTSKSSRTQGSVIHLVNARTPLEPPYTIRTSRTSTGSP